MDTRAIAGCGASRRPCWLVSCGSRPVVVACRRGGTETDVRAPQPNAPPESLWGHEALPEREELLREAERIAHVGSWAWDMGTGRVAWSDELYAILGLDPARDEATFDAFLASILPADRPYVYALRPRAAAGDVAERADFRIQRPDGTLREVTGIAQIFRGPDRAPRRMIGTVMDVTSQKRLERQLAQAQKMEALGRIAGGVAHDFNNLLTIILLNVRSIMQDEKDERLERIQEAATHGASLTRQLTTFSRQNVVPRVAALDLNVVAKATLELAARVVADGIDTRFIPSAEPAAVFADEGQMHQVLLNLIVNARDAMPAGGTLEVAVAIVDPPENVRDLPVRASRYVRLSVRDTGTGMDEAVRARVFEPFFTTKEAGKGSGLGLATVFGIVAQNGGVLVVDSQLGEGSTMHVYLPLDGASVTTRAPAGDADDLGGTETLLVVEDDPGVRATLCAVLTAKGYDVIQAGRPSRVLELWREQRGRVALLVSDVVMPEMSGPELAAKLREDAPELPVLFVTGHDPAPALDRMPGARWLAKPFASAELLQAVRSLLGGPGCRDSG